MAESTTNPLAGMSIAALHDMGMDFLNKARQQYTRDPSPGAAASIAIASFFASMSADNLAAATGSHRSDDPTPPRGTPAVARPEEDGVNEFTGHHA